MAALIAA